MRSSLALLIALAVLLVSTLLGGVLISFMAQEGELGHVMRTGLLSQPEKFSWSEWRRNDGSARPLAVRSQQPVDIAEFRVGHARELLMDFVAYEGRTASGAVVPASGPHWGASYGIRWLVPAAIAGAFALVAWIRIRAEGRAAGNAKA